MTDKSWMLNPKAIRQAKECIQLKKILYMLLNQMLSQNLGNPLSRHHLFICQRSCMHYYILVVSAKVMIRPANAVIGSQLVRENT